MPHRGSFVPIEALARFFKLKVKTRLWFMVGTIGWLFSLIFVSLRRNGHGYLGMVEAVGSALPSLDDLP